MRILVVEDNFNIQEAVVSFLALEGFDTDSAGTVREARELFQKSPDLVILDIMLPDGNGYHFAREVRESSSVPIIFLTAKGSESERIMGFEVGGDDYMVKPFSVKELVLRVKAVLKRQGSQEKPDQKVVYSCQNSRIQLFKEQHRVLVDDIEVNLTPAEWKILDYLVCNSHIVLSKERILENCLDYNFNASERIVITHIKNLREKLGEKPWIETIRGFGYRFSGEK